MIYFGTIYKNDSQEEFVVFNAKRSTIISERKGEDIVIYSKDSLTENTMNFVIKPYVVGNFASVSKTEKLHHLYYFDNRKILVVDSLGIIPPRISPDILVFTQSPKINLERLLQTVKPKLIIADASNYKTYAERWKETCIKKNPFSCNS